MFFLIAYSFITTIFVGILIVGLYQKNSNAICKSKRRLDGKTAIVTGGTSGMGLEIAIDFALRGARVIVACPFQDEGETGKETIIKRSGNENVIFEHLDLASFASVRKFAETIMKKENRLDILVNNAGVNAATERLTEDGFNFIYQVNYFGTVLLTLLLLPLLKRNGKPDEPSRIVNTSSISHKLGKVDFESWKKTNHHFKCYPNSKLCIAMFSRELAKRNEYLNVTVNVIDPGIVGTRIYRTATDAFLGPIAVFLATFCSKTPWEGAQTAIHVAVCENARKENGKYFANCKVSPKIPLKEFYDDNLNEVLWDKTVEVIGWNK
ncbi:retinol dehydrogenase 13-like [Amyelois transitella]|uniref:retinol dehydrogenase 13-like n=1 Tax=Amyelois transitella TaxID=680683 RepID=UPI00067CF0BC|nr:retinol dehydrogenase 13-like [Amyelois transitella]